MRTLRITLLSALFALASPLSGVASAAPAEPSVQISSQAEIILPTTIRLDVSAVCLPDAGPFGTIFVKASQDETAGGGSTVVQIPCDGHRHQLAVFLSPGPWVPADGLADAIMVVFTTFGQQYVSDRITKKIQIQ